MIRCLLFEQFENGISRRGGMADAPDSKSGGGNIVWVQVPSPALIKRACEKTRVFSCVLLLMDVIVVILHKKGYSSPYPIRMLL